MSSTAGDKLKVQVVYALPEEQRVIDIEVPRGTTLRNAVERSRIADHFPDFDLAVCELGIFGAVRDSGDLVAAGDRIEIYRPLEDDPKAIRRRRAREQRSGKR